MYGRSHVGGACCHFGTFVLGSLLGAPWSMTHVAAAADIDRETWGRGSPNGDRQPVAMAFTSAGGPTVIAMRMGGPRLPFST